MTTEAEEKGRVLLTLDVSGVVRKREEEMETTYVSEKQLRVLETQTQSGH